MLLQAARVPLTPQRRLMAIDIHIHAEESCGMHRDDGYDDFQERRVDYFKSPHLRRRCRYYSIDSALNSIQCTVTVTRGRGTKNNLSENILRGWPLQQAGVGVGCGPGLLRNAANYGDSTYSQRKLSAL
jgi:hypothetical protein